MSIFSRLIGLALLTLAAMITAWCAAPVAVVQLRSPVRIDGNTADWKNLTAMQTINGHDGAVATVRAVYDSTYLYLLVEVKDDSPLKNGTGASDAAMMLKGGDAVGICIGKVEPQRILLAQLEGKAVMMLYRQKSSTKQPYTFASPVSSITFDYVAPLREAQAALKTVDGGYVAECRLAWSVLGLQPAVGLTFPFDVQVIFSDAAGKMNADTAWWRSTGAGPLCTVDLPTEAQLYPDAWGTAQLFLTDPDPQVGAAAAKQDAGTPITFTLPQQANVSMRINDAKGWSVRELLLAEPMAVGTHTVIWDGRDDYGDPLPPGEYSWRLAYFQGVGSKRIGGAGNSAKPPYRTPDRKGDLGAVHGAPVATASDAGGVYHLGGCEEGNYGFTKLNVNGEALWKHSLGGFGIGRAVAADGQYAYIIVKVGQRTDLVRMDADTGRDMPIAEKGPRIQLGDATLDVAAMAVTGHQIFYSSPSQNCLKVLDLATGEFGLDIAINAPTGLCALDEKTLLVCSETQVLKLNIVTGQATAFLTGLDTPRAIAVGKDGIIYVAEQGASQQIARFSPQGKLLAKLGHPGGRPATCNPYDPNMLYQIGSLCLGPDGNIWFMEHSVLRRMGVMTTDGKWVKDIFETIPSQGGAGVDLDDMSRVFYHPEYGPQICQAKIDFATGSWKLEAVFRMTQAGDYTDPSPDDLGALSTKSAYSVPIAFTGVNGLRYYWQEQDPSGISSLWVMRQGRLVPIQMIGKAKNTVGTLIPKDKGFCWSDANGDGNIQAEEIVLGDFTGGRFLDRDLTLHTGWLTLKPYKIDARGVPYYRIEDAKPVITDGKLPSYYYRDGSYGIQVSPPAPDGGVYYAFNIGTGQGRSFWDRCTYSRLARVTNGKLEWMAGRHDGRLLRDGDINYLWRPLGEVDGVVVVGDVDFQLVAYTSDGFALGNVTPHPRRRLDLGIDTPESIVQENVQSGHFFRDPQTGKPIVIIGSGTEVLALEVTGIDPTGIKRVSGNITLASAQARMPEATSIYPICYQTWKSTDNGRFYGVNGDDWEWDPSVPSLSIRNGKTLIGDVRLRRDCGSLHVYASVLDSTPLPEMEAVKDPAQLYGKTDGVEILIGPAEPKARVSAVAGDTRIVLTAVRENGRFRGIALASRPANGAVGLVPIPGAKVAVREALNGQGYHLEAEIPLALLPEISRETEVSFLRNYWPGATRKGDYLERYTEVKPDLFGALRLNVAVLQDDGQGGVVRFPWVADGHSTIDPREMRPATWGLADAP